MSEDGMDFRQGSSVPRTLKSAGNSTTATLAGDATFTGTAHFVRGFGEITIFSLSDVASADAGVTFESSSDGTNWDSALPVGAHANERMIHTLAVISSWFRVVYINGSAAQSFFRMEVLLHATSRKLTSRANTVVHDDYDVQLVRPVTNEGTDLAAGLNADRTLNHKFGGQLSIASTYSPVCIGALYNMPQVGSATTLRVKAGNANDTAAGSGAQEISLQGLDQLGVEQTVTLATAGGSASSATSVTFIRLYRAWVSASGTYATVIGDSHAADIVIENGSGGTDWATIRVSDVARGQTQIGCYSVPLGKQAFIHDFHMTTDGAKPVDFMMYQRMNILATSAPYSAIRVIQEVFGIENEYTFSPLNPLGPFVALSDIVFLAKGANSPEVSVDFEIELVDSLH